MKEKVNQHSMGLRYAKLNYKTRADSSPQGKSRVYFSAHPDDYPIFFQSISDKILEKQNCVIWYDEEPGAEYEETQWLSDLSQMQLFVVPVTSNYLGKENRALKLELPYALKHRIPVLMLMEENNLEAVYAEKCGDIQYLNPYVKDDSVDDFDTKLEKFLDDVLVGDELAAQVRAAFDAYIFLSYRKKDRKYAVELMKLIHKNDFCRDIAIWYDEYLVPGENFNTAIEEALRKSDLFALAVTPNLINESNYVMDVEYPKAIEAKKIVLPMELVPTDHKQLEESYNNIPVCIDARDENTMEQSLLEAIKRIAIRENDKDPRHNFFIGLAYLNGIDVEVDHKRAVEMITMAAEAKVPMAVEKLVFMYQNGEAVERDYNKATEWQEKLVEKYRTDYEADKEEKKLYNYIFSLYELGNQYLGLKKLEKGKQSYLEMKTIADSLKEDSNWKVLLLSLEAYNKLGDVFQAEGNLEEAHVYFQTYLNRMKLLSERKNVVRNMMEVHQKTGALFLLQHKYDKAKAAYNEALQNAENETKKEDAAEVRREIASLYLNFSSLYQQERNDLLKQGDLDLAAKNLGWMKEYTQKALDINILLEKEWKTTTSRRDVSVCYSHMGKVCVEENQLEKAREYYVKSLEINREIMDETGTIESRRDISIGYNRLGDVYKKEKNFPEAVQCYEKGLEIAKALMEETGIVEHQLDVAIGHEYLGDIYIREKKTVQAREHYLEEQKIFREVATKSRRIGLRQEMSVQKRLNDVDKVEEKEKCLLKLEAAEEAMRKTGSLESRLEVATYYDTIAAGTKVMGNHVTDVKAWYEKAINLRNEIRKESDDVVNLQALSESYHTMGWITRAEGKIEEASDYFDKALQISTALKEMDKSGRADWLSLTIPMQQEQIDRMKKRNAPEESDKEKKDKKKWKGLFRFFRNN